MAFAAPANVYLALLTVIPDDTSTGSTITEATYGSYARTQIGTANNQTDAWNAATGTTTAVVTNKNNIVCPAASSGSSTVVAIAVTDAAAAGNVLYWTTVTSVVINPGNTPRVNASDLSITED